LSVAAVPAATIAYQTYNALNESSDAAARAASYASFIRTEAKTDPVYALYLLGSDDALDVFNIEDHFFVMQQAMVALLDTGYPTGFEAASLQDADVAGSPSAQPQADSVPVTFDQKHSSLVIGDAALAPLEFVPVAVEPNVWCVSPDGALLAYASDRLVYVYALGSMTTPSVLYGNSERVTALSIDDAQVHARTESGATVTWERPFLPRMTSRSTTAVENCSMAMGDEGVIVAFVENSHVVISGHGTERSLTLPAGQQPSQRLALSPDGARVAVVTEGDAGMQSVLVMNVADGTVQATASLEHPVIGAAFSNDGSEVALACSDGGGITCVNVADGTVRSSEESGLVGFAVAPYQGGYVLVDAYGTALVYDADLHVASQMMSLEPIAVPPKQLAIAEDQGLAFVANRGGNSSTGCARLNLGDGSQAIFLLPTNDGMVSNTSVAVSADGALVAFGYPDGTVTVWDARKMNQLCRKSMIAEQVSGLMFSQDGTALHAVGGSGTVYELDIREDLASYDASDYEATWQRYRDRGAAIRADLEALGLDVSFH
jgi:WD40 repeat protein